MIKNSVFEQYLSALLNGNRKDCRAIIEETMHSGVPANSIYLDIIWPVMVEVEKLVRADKISSVAEHLATRINRTIVDQLQNKLPCKPSRKKKIVICCDEAELQELGAQMMADLFESDGWEVKFLGGGLTNDDVLGFVHKYSPEILLIYGTSPKQAPGIRQLIDRVREINAQPDMRIMLSGGLFNRAEGLWQEMGADFFAATAAEAVEIACDSKKLEAEPPTINRRKRRHKRAVKESAIDN